MSIKLLAASVNAVDPSQPPEASISLAPLAQRATTTRSGHAGAVPLDAFAWSTSTRRYEPARISATLIEDSQSDQAGHSAWEYVSGWVWSRLADTAVDHYLAYAAAPVHWSGRLVNLYA